MQTNRPAQYMARKILLYGTVLYWSIGVYWKQFYNVSIEMVCMLAGSMIIHMFVCLYVRPSQNVRLCSVT